MLGNVGILPNGTTIHLVTNEQNMKTCVQRIGLPANFQGMQTLVGIRFNFYPVQQRHIQIINNQQHSINSFNCQKQNNTCSKVMAQQNSSTFSSTLNFIPQKKSQKLSNHNFTDAQICSTTPLHKPIPISVSEFATKLAYQISIPKEIPEPKIQEIEEINNNNTLSNDVESQFSSTSSAVNEQILPKIHENFIKNVGDLIRNDDSPGFIDVVKVDESETSKILLKICKNNQNLNSKFSLNSPTQSMKNDQSDDESDQGNEFPQTTTPKSENQFDNETSKVDEPSSASTSDESCINCQKTFIEVGKRYAKHPQYCSNGCRKEFKQVRKANKRNANFVMLNSAENTKKSRQSLVAENHPRTFFERSRALKIRIKSPIMDVSNGSSSSSLLTTTKSSINPTILEYLNSAENAGLKPENIMNWKSKDVQNFVNNIVNPVLINNYFEREEIDGSSLLMLNFEHLKSMEIKLGPALKIGKAIEWLKSQKL